MRILPIVLLLIALSGCAAPRPAVELGGEWFTVEVADDLDEQRMGMMFREEMDDDAGMIFTYTREAPRAFWMKNCKIALDIIYFDADGVMINVHENVPPCRSEPCPNYPSTAPAQYVLELKGGRFSQLDVAPGAELKMTMNL